MQVFPLSQSSFHYTAKFGERQLQTPQSALGGMGGVWPSAVTPCAVPLI